MSFANGQYDAKNLRNALEYGNSTCGATVVRIAYPYWQENTWKTQSSVTISKPGIHLHSAQAGDNQNAQAADNGDGYITIPKNVTLVVEKPEYLIWDGTETPIIFKLEEGAAILHQLPLFFILPLFLYSYVFTSLQKRLFSKKNVDVNKQIDF